jgi:type I restriction enzyme S subunit
MPLGDFATLQRGHDLPDERRRLGNVPILGSFGVTGWHDEAKARGPGVTVGRSGASFGVVSYSAVDYWPLNTALYVINFHGNDQRFAYYFLKTFDFEGYNSGSAQPSLNRNFIHPVSIEVPPLPEQRAIAHILGTLDDKIELNRRMSETLEAMARALFKSWFVDFDPVRAKMEGREPGLPKHLADLFPDRLVESELGEIPEGWRVKSVEDEFELTMGQSPPGETYNDIGEGKPFYQGRADFESRFPKRRVYCTAPTRHASAGDTLISVRAPVGDINMAVEDCAIGRGVAAARHRSGSRSYTYQFMLGLENIFARFEAEGTVFGSISKRDFHAIPCVVPSARVVECFETKAAPLDTRIEVVARESRTLAALRDTLLPKLISGELRLKDAARFVGRIDEVERGGA